jgi:3',5'-cyclic AMP phosphodiesterase CpdA
LKRRVLIALGLGGLATAVGQQYVYRPDSKTAVALPENLPKNSPENSPEDLPPASSPNNSSDRSFQFVVIGDVGTGESGQYAVSRAMEQYWQSTPFPLVLLTGDNLYENGEIDRIEEAFERPYAGLLQKGVKFYASLGNHDFRTNQGEDEIAYPGYNMAGRYYSFTQQSVQFFALDTNQAYLSDNLRETPWNAQVQWLRKALRDSSAPWKVVFAHHPIYSSGMHGSDRELERVLSPLLAEYGVQLYINGHDHNYERTQPINRTTYITSGNGAKLRSVGRSHWTAHASSQLGFTAFEVQADRLVVRAFDTEGRVYDEAQIMASAIVQS